MFHNTATRHPISPTAYRRWDGAIAKLKDTAHLREAKGKLERDPENGDSGAESGAIPGGESKGSSDRVTSADRVARGGAGAAINAAESDSDKAEIGVETSAALIMGRHYRIFRGRRWYRGGLNAE